MSTFTVTLDCWRCGGSATWPDAPTCPCGQTRVAAAYLTTEEPLPGPRKERHLRLITEEPEGEEG